MIHGFYISKLELRGKAIKPASLEFEKGFNLISGGSDTGKSYTYNLLEYMLGKIETPIPIPESRGYINSYLEINTHTGSTYTLFRKLSGGDFHIKECRLSEFDTSVKKIEQYGVYPNSTNNISDFLLRLCGFESSIYIKSKQDNTKRKFTFTLLRNLTFVDETKITSKTSPVYGSQNYVEYTLNKNTLSFILTGKNANSLESEVDNQQMKSWTNGKIDFIQSQTNHFTDSIAKLKEEKLKYLNTPKDSVEELKNKLNNLNESLVKFTTAKAKLFEEIESRKSTVIYKNELLIRLQLLKKHYLSDKQRLEFIMEGEQLLNQLNTVDCPICEGVIDDEQISHIHNSENVKESIEVESTKIQLKLTDLTKTIEANIEDVKVLEEEIDVIEIKYNETDRLISNELNPKLDNLRAEISNANVIYELDAKISVYNDELEYYLTEESGLKSELTREVKTSTTSEDGAGIEKLSKMVKDILKKWNYDSNVDVTFDKSHQVFDIVISNKPRASYGKGMRSISYTAFIISVLKYCLINSRPFSNLLVFDSPLTTYHKGLVTGNETEEEVSKGIQESFFRDLSMTQDNCQIIVFDNKFPDDKTSAKINFTYFTKDKRSGRYGLFPSS